MMFSVHLAASGTLHCAGHPWLWRPKAVLILPWCPISYQERLGLLQVGWPSHAQRTTNGVVIGFVDSCGSGFGNREGLPSGLARVRLSKSNRLVRVQVQAYLGLDQQALSLCPHWLFNRSLTRSLGEHPGCVKFVLHLVCLYDMPRQRCF